MFFGYYVLKVACEFSSAESRSHKEVDFQGRDEADCLAKAREAGWSLTDHRALCRFHARREALKEARRGNARAKPGRRTPRAQHRQPGSR